MEALDTLKLIIPIILVLITWYIWSLKQKFLTKEEIKFLMEELDNEIAHIKEKHSNEIKELENKVNSKVRDMEVRINTQSEDIREIKTHLKHISEALINIKEDIKDFFMANKKRKA